MSHTNLNKTLNCKEAMQKLSELLGDTNVNDCNNNLHESLEELEKLANERNFLDILNQKYPTFIGFQSSDRKKRVPKIIIREKKRHCNISNNKSGLESDLCIKPESNSKTSIISVATNNTNVVEIREIIDTLLPKDTPQFKVISSEGLKNCKSSHTPNRAIKNNPQDNLLRLEVEKLVDELLDEVPSTSQYNNKTY
ncbi:hypothetical protein QE152_g7377 [Popillia japonica]|uniref:Uncharacterized protein n=1 Tax=Popillia japonica TaxID=7064 RepID=A0AAW1MF30_POPJA